VRRGPHRFNVGIDGLGNRPGAGHKRRITEAERSRVITLACYAITSLTVTQATHAQLSAATRGHRGIEDRLHRVFDMDFDEDRSQVLTASGPRIMASLLATLASPSCSWPGEASIIAALRYHARQPSRPLRMIMKC
jgi:predicted transposase YbfD/YdcC